MTNTPTQVAQWLREEQFLFLQIHQISSELAFSLNTPSED